MKIELKRKRLTDKATLGELYLDGVFECVTLEDVVRDFGPNGAGKLFGETAIPAGTYRVVINMSNRFKRLMPLLLAVPYFTGIRMHSGNRSANTEGCILLGSEIGGDDLITRSTIAFTSFFTKLQAALMKGEEAWITITDEFKETANV